MFDVILGTYSGPKNKISKKFSTQTTYSCQANDVVDVKNPNILIATSDNLSNLNYAYIADFSRYYFIVDCSVQPNGLWTLSLKEDVLKTYENQLKTTKAAFNRSSDFYNMYLPDHLAPVTQRQIITNKVFPNSPFDNQLETHGAIVLISGAE